MTEPKLTPLQLTALVDIDFGAVHQEKHGSGPWRIQGASPSAVGRLVGLGLAVWAPLQGPDFRSCVLTDAGRLAIAYTKNPS